MLGVRVGVGASGRRAGETQNEQIRLIEKANPCAAATYENYMVKKNKKHRLIERKRIVFAQSRRFAYIIILEVRYAGKAGRLRENR